MFRKTEGRELQREMEGGEERERARRRERQREMDVEAEESLRLRFVLSKWDLKLGPEFCQHESHTISIWGLFELRSYSSCSEEGDGRPAVLRRWHWHWLQTHESEPGIWSSRCGETTFIGLYFCLFQTMPDRQSDKRRPIKDGNRLVQQVLGGRLTHKCICG